MAERTLYEPRHWNKGISSNAVPSFDVTTCITTCIYTQSSSSFRRPVYSILIRDAHHSVLLRNGLDDLSKPRSSPNRRHLFMLPNGTLAQTERRIGECYPHIGVLGPSPLALRQHGRHFTPGQAVRCSQRNIFSNAPCRKSI